MAKEKYVLTSDLVKIESEPNTYDLVEREIPSNNKVEYEPKEQINLKISKTLKNDFQIWCINNDKKMTEGLEMAITQLIKGVLSAE